MGTSSGEELIIKTRKPYTITKQRERWTVEEHNRFLEALKLYGRAWQRIEEHIGTKTAVQIRSHAQKFFSKLEKEAHAKGVPVGQALDLDIPPPRPKRKPSNPYPRKTGIGAPTSQTGVKDGKLVTSVSSLHCKQALDLEKEPLPEPNGDGKPSNAKENQDESCSEVFTLLQEAHCSCVSSVNKNSTPTTLVQRSSCTFREFIPSLKKVVNQDEINESYVTVELKGKQKFDNDNGTTKASSLEISCPSHDKSVQYMEKDYLNGALPTDDMQGTQNYPRHVPVHILDGSLGTCIQSPPPHSIFHPMREVHGHSNLFTDPAACATTEHQNNVPSSSHQTFPTFHPPFIPIRHDQDDYRSFLHISSTFSSLIVSTLLQNPAAHAAARFAASYWPYANAETSADSQPSRQTSSAPSMAAIAAATVAAATAWWAAHGLLPLCAPPHTAFTCPPPSTTAVPSTDTDKVPAGAKTDRKENTLQILQDEQLDLVSSETLQAQQSASKSPTLLSSGSESRGTELNTASKAADHEKAVTELHDSNKTKSRKQVDRSSCGSNTPSSSEVETDALEKHEKGNEELKEADTNHPVSESSNRRSRSSSNMSESWKEVSEEGRLAFRALFSREILPQSFSPPHDLKNKEHKKDNIGEDKRNTNGLDGVASALDLNSKIWGFSFNHQVVEKNALLAGANIDQEGLLTIGLGHGMLKARRTGFKPYKRSSVEAKENIVVNITGQGEEKCPKRIRLEEEAST